MNPTFEPIIGSSFDSIAGQRFGWAGYNRGVESDNLNRLAKAQQTRNDWDERSQAIRQLQMDKQTKADIYAQEMAEAARQFDIKSQLGHEANLTRYGEERLRTDAINHQTRVKEMDFNRYDAETDNIGNSLSSDVSEYMSALEKSRSDLDAATTALNTKGAELENEVPAGLVSFNPKVGFVALTPTDPVAAKAAAAANLKLAKSKADYEQAESRFNYHNDRATELTKAAGARGLRITRRGNDWVVENPMTRKAYRSEARQEMPANRFSPVMGARQMADNASMEDSASRFTPPTTATVTSPSAPPASAPVSNLPKVRTAQEAEAYIAQANAAIRRGADPVAVKARLVEMGIQLRD